MPRIESIILMLKLTFQVVYATAPSGTSHHLRSNIFLSRTLQAAHQGDHVLRYLVYRPIPHLHHHGDKECHSLVFANRRQSSFLTMSYTYIK